jgi:hypothetical protein
MKDQASIEKTRQELLADCGPPHVDDVLLGMIEDGSEALTDELFFKLLKETPAYLGTRPFLKKIGQWQLVLGHALWNDEKGKKEQKIAKNNLKAIGTTLAFEGQGRPAKTNDTYLYGKYLQYLHLVESVKASVIEHDAEPINLLLAFIGQYPEYAKHFNLKGERRHRSPKEIAIILVIKECGVQGRTVRYAITKCLAPSKKRRSVASKKISK